MQLERKPHPFMPTRAEGHDPNVCAAKDCGQVWNSIKHQPSLYLEALTPEFVDPIGTPEQVEAHRQTVSEAVRKLSEAARVPEGLVMIERPSGPPYVVPAAAPATHSGRPAQHSGALAHNGVTTEFHECDRRDPHFRHLWQPGERTEFFTCRGADPTPYHLFKGGLYDDCGFPGCGLDQSAPVHQRPEPLDVMTMLDSGPVLKMFEDYCTHPNGFGVMGCPCGASADDPEGEIRFRHIPTGEDEPTIDCPSCDSQLVPLSVMAQHLREVHLLEWPEGRIREFMKEYDLNDDTTTSEDYDPPARCSLSADCIDIRFTRESALRNHLADVHQADPATLALHLDNPWREGEERADWKTRTFHKRYGMSAESIRDAKTALSADELTAAMKDGLVAPGLKVLGRMQDAMARSVDNFLNAEIPTEELIRDAEEEDVDLSRVPLEQALTEWWMDRAEEESRTVIPKAVAYGSNSLLQLGRKMAQLKGRLVSDEEAMELGCWVYAVGKIERWTDAVMRGERPSDDSLYDLGIYVKMVQRIRDAGSWPGV